MQLSVFKVGWNLSFGLMQAYHCPAGAHDCVITQSNQKQGGVKKIKTENKTM